MTDIWQSFVGTLDIQEDNMAIALASLIKFLGFEDFEKSDVSIGGDYLSTEVYSIDDRRVFVSVIENINYITGKYIITDKNNDILDIITFKRNGNEWIEY